MASQAAGFFRAKPRCGENGKISVSQKATFFYLVFFLSFCNVSFQSNLTDGSLVSQNKKRRFQMVMADGNSAHVTLFGAR